MTHLTKEHKNELDKILDNIAQHLKGQDGGYNKGAEELYSKLDAIDQVIQYMQHVFDES